ncbi:hypothetical protein, partial [Pseudomonas phage vB_Pae_CF118b]
TRRSARATAQAVARALRWVWGGDCFDTCQKREE